LPERKVRCERGRKEKREKKSEIDRGRREMEASGSTPPSARVFRKFDKSRPTIPRLSSIPLFPTYFSSASQPRRTHRPAEQAMKFPRRPNLSLFPGRSGPGPDIHAELSSSKAPIAIAPLSSVPCLPLIWPESTFYFPVCLSARGHSRATYFAVTLLSSARVDHATQSRFHKRASQKGEKESRLIGA